MSSRAERTGQAIALALAVGWVLQAAARPGGGEGYSSPGGDGGGGGGDGVSLLLVELVFRLLFYLVFQHPLIGVPIVVAVVIFIVWRSRSPTPQDWSTVDARTLPGEEDVVPGGALRGRALLARLSEKDPDFSAIAFEDFVYALYGRVHADRGAQKLERWSMYVGQDARAALASLTPPDSLSAVEGVVVGSLRYAAVSGVEGERVRVILQLEANYTEIDPAEKQRTFWAVENWALSRDTRTRSKPPGDVDAFGCPNCGASIEDARGNVCAYCHTQVDTGAFNWVVDAASTLRREERGPQLLGTAPERGGERPTRRMPGLDAALAELIGSDPALSLAAIEQRTELIHAELNAAWTARDWRRVRPYVSDPLFQMQVYWIETYRRAKLINKLDGAKVTRIEPAAVSRDRWFDALTVRIHATGRDFKVRESDGSVVSGSATRDRPYTEYWTLIRGRGVQHAVTVDKHCPNCAAELDVNQAGVCSYCSTKITSGAFDWVLSRIEQDESYTG